MSTHEHKKNAITNIGYYVITVSDTRTKEDDTGGQLIMSMVKDGGHSVVGYEIIKDDLNSITKHFLEITEREDVDAVIMTGGTGIARRDITPEAILPLLDKNLPGFGEIFRGLSMQEIGSAAMMSRALAGTKNGKAIFCIPGSRGGIRLAMGSLILEETGHMLWEMRK
ncbi:MAG: MogA/MoaB family molybdenum cofactor biosynthesis protein [Candidatus Thermoplasmatota archaeon]|nr:MogA/MoaB family molybdenum cofactor biosynthesis protein [Euryarchaeota archaeon]MBU4032447.1 MogA/MoaB family molybdenum cofactor biosynthesis protein [Candidatus Thermoplasmatota archaeon]MBU4071560.1 MogA/MoaB family molybdenum cofactor biosynthesis protein [Candidatus Thermoplasmatota archaeon]MBU4144473.1 MogA/MoaB family molybdenum cofactor biosynthesis protein [Candidatus Thermoplasmatota archaeon]MBU4592295.1 MogA/MoaB family molybdenum cofactor biosynthesis protein [Candidatus Ther